MSHGDIELEEVKAQMSRIPESSISYNVDVSQYNSTISLPGGFKEEIDESDEFTNYSHDPNHFIVTAVKGYQRSSLFWCLAVGLCAMRCANPFTVTLAFMSLIFRVVQLSAIYTQNINVAQGAYLLATFTLGLMFLAEMFKEQADIIHETHPTRDQMMDMEADIYTPNYRPDRRGGKLI